MLLIKLDNMIKLLVAVGLMFSTVATAKVNYGSGGNSNEKENRSKKMEKMDDTKAILAVIDTYIEGLRQGRVDLLKKSFHKDAIMHGYSRDNKITEGSVQHLYDIIEKAGALSNVTAKNKVLNQTSNTAFVLAELKSTAPNENSTDYLSLMKIDGQWKIISKVYHLSYAK